MMNRLQRINAFLALAAVAGVGIYPPWYHAFEGLHNRVEYHNEYALVFSQPTAWPLDPRPRDIRNQPREDTLFASPIRRIDMAALIAHWVTILAAGLAMHVILGIRRTNKKPPPERG